MNGKKNILDSAQTLLLELIKSKKYGTKNTTMTLENVAREIGVNSPQAVKSKVKQLHNKGYLKLSDDGELIVFIEPINDMVYLPILGMAQCGNLGGFSVRDMDYVEKMPFPTRILDMSTPSPSELEKYFLVRAAGDSMLPLIKNNDILLVKEQKECNFGDFTLVIHNEIPKVKRIQKLDNGGIILVSTNISEPPKELSENDELTVVGIIKKNISSY